MSIRAKQEICLHLSHIRCLSNYQSGHYVLRFHIYEEDKNYQQYAVPVNVIETK